MLLVFGVVMYGRLSNINVAIFHGIVSYKVKNKSFLINQNRSNNCKLSFVFTSIHLEIENNFTTTQPLIPLFMEKSEII